MATNYPVGDFLIRIKNLAMAGKKEMSCKNSGLIYAVAKVLKSEGYLSELSRKDGEIFVKLAYRRKEPVLLDIKIASKPGMRVYVNVNDIETKQDIATYVLSTPEGVMSSDQALKKRVGGELIAKVW